MGQQLSDEQWRDRVLSAFPGDRYEYVSASVTHRRGPRGFVVTEYNACVFVAPVGHSPGAPDNCTAVPGDALCDPEAALSATRAKVAALETAWAEWRAANPTSR